MSDKQIQREILKVLHELNEQLLMLHYKFDSFDKVREETDYDMTHEQLHLPLTGDNS